MSHLLNDPPAQKLQKFLLFLSLFFISDFSHSYAANISDFGAACNGKADDLLAWDEAFAAALQSPHGDLVEMSGGCHSYISATITVTVPGNKLIGITGKDSSSSEIIVANGQSGMQFLMVSDGNYVMQPGETGAGVILKHFAISATAEVTPPSNVGIFIRGDTIAGTQTPASSVQDVILKGTDETSGWGTGISLYRTSNFSIRNVRIKGSLSSRGIIVSGGEYNSGIYSVDTHIYDYKCESLNVCVIVQGQTQGVFVKRFDFINVNFGLQALGSIGVYGQSQNNISLADGNIISRLAGVQLINIPFWSVNDINFKSSSSVTASSNAGLDLNGAMHGSATGNSFDMSGGLCARLSNNTYRSNILGGFCKNTPTGFLIDGSSSDNSITGVTFVDTPNRVVNYGYENDIDQ